MMEIIIIMEVIVLMGNKKKHASITDLIVSHKDWYWYKHLQKE